MPILPSSVSRIAAVAALVSGLAFAGASYAAPFPESEYTADQPMPPSAPPPPDRAPGHGDKMGHDPKAMAQHVEQRIKTLHDKLGITDAEETKWSDVAQTMRDNETAIGQLIQARHQDPEHMTAIDDLQSYGNLTQAHADGIKKLIPVFQSLYNDMSDDQKKTADKVFGRFEGHHGDKPAKKHG